MKPLLFFMGCVLVFPAVQSQTCIGGVNYSSATFWNPAWIGGCTNGTACTGSPMILDTRPSSCTTINTTNIDACAPAPSCTGLNLTAADLWFRFYACSTSATIHVVQHVSYVTSIQAFASSSPICSGLSEIGCSVAGGPSGGVSLTLTGLTPNNLYYFRVFGAASTLSQTTGAWCFCGTTGLCPAILLPARLLSFRLINALPGNRLEWRATDQERLERFELERSTDGINYVRLGQVKAIHSGFPEVDYTYTDPAPDEAYYYRLKMISDNDHFDYSTVIKSAINRGAFRAYYDHNQSILTIHSGSATTFSIHSLNGSMIQRALIPAGKSSIFLALDPGVYLVSDLNGTVQKIISYSN